MDRGRVGEDRGSKEMDGCPLTSLHARPASIDGQITLCYPTIRFDPCLSTRIVLPTTIASIVILFLKLRIILCFFSDLFSLSSLSTNKTRTLGVPSCR
jgi:hypothetical protein